MKKRRVDGFETKGASERRGPRRDAILARMGERNLGVVARWAEAIQHGDLAEDLWDADLEIVNEEGWAVEATYRGHDGLRRWWDDLAEAFSDFAMEVEEITPLDEERFLTVQRFVGHFRVTGIPFDERWASVITVRAGRIIGAVGYLSKGRALRAFERGSAEA
jgi:ketosteroid isomerase-like protein